MSRGLLRNDVTDAEGNAVQGALVTVYVAGTLTKATLYSESIGGVIIANPLTTDVKGVFQAFVETGEYDLAVVTAAGTENVYNIPVLDADDVASIEANLATSQQQIDDLTAISKAFVRTPEQVISAQTVVSVPEITDQTADITTVFLNGAAFRSGYSISAGQVTFDNPQSGDFWALIPFTNPIGTTTAGAVTDTSRGQSVQETVNNSVQGVDTLAELKALPAFDGAHARINLGGRAGSFRFNSAPLSAEVTSDTQEGIYVAPTGQDGSTGAWVRQYGQAVDSNPMVKAAWFGPSELANHGQLIQDIADAHSRVDWGDYAYNVDSVVSITPSNDVDWQGTATFLNTSASHVGDLFTIFAPNLDINIGPLTFDGALLANCGIRIDAQGVTDMADAGNVTFDGTKVRRIKRISGLGRGDGINVRGGYKKVLFKEPDVYDCRLAAGAGTTGVIGVSGITVFGNDPAAYPQRMTIQGGKIEKIWSEDLDYQFDQDGCRLFSPHTALGGAVVHNFAEIIGTDFKNCYGRSIKTQAFSAKVIRVTCERDEGLNSNLGNNEIAIQVSTGTVKDSTFIYRNGQNPGAVVGQSSGAVTGGRPSVKFSDSEIYTFDTAMVNYGLQTFPSGLLVGKSIIDNVKCFGSWIGAANVLINGDDQNTVEVKNTVSTDIVLGDTSERALIYVRSSGGDSPYGCSVTAHGNVYHGADSVSICRAKITGNAADAWVSAYENEGFIDDKSAQADESALANNQLPRFGGFQSRRDNLGGWTVLHSDAVADGATVTVPIHSSQGSTLLFQARQARNHSALFSADSGGTAVIYQGASVEVGNTTEPATGTWRLWVSGTNELSVKNTSGSTRLFSILEVSPG